MKRCIINAIAKRILFAVLLVFSLGINQSFAQQEQTLFGPLTFMRTTGKPNEFNYSFNKLPGFSGPFRLIVINGEENGQNRISSAKVILNGVTVLHESQLNQKIEKLDLGIQLADVNTLQAVIKSKPGGFIKVSVVGQVQPGAERVLAEASGVVGPAGGSVSLDDFAKVTLPELPARPELLLKVQKIESPVVASHIIPAKVL